MNVIGTIGMQPLDKEKLRKTIFNYSNTEPLPKLTCTYMKNVQPQAQTNSIIVPNDSSPVQLFFDIKGELKDAAQQLFVTDKWGDNPILPSRTVNTFKESPFQSFKLYRKGKPNEILLIDVRFEIENEP